MNEWIRMKIVVIGGCIESLEKKCLSCIEVFDENVVGVLRENVLAHPRRGAAAFSSNDCIYVCGGTSGPGEHLKSIEKIDNNFGSTVIEMELQNGFGSCFAFCEAKDLFFICGGFNGLECLSSASLMSFIPPSQASFRLPTPLKNAAACQNPFDSNSILLFGGWDEKRTLNTIFNVSLVDFKTTLTSLLPYPVEGHTATLIHNSIFIIGGYDGINCISTICKYDQNGTQILAAKLEIPRENHCTVFLESKQELWVIGGWTGEKSLNSIERFQITKDNNSLKKLEPLSLTKPRQKAATIIID